MEKERYGRLIEEVIAGDSAALEELLEWKTDQVYYMALGVLGNHHDAEDVTQEVLVVICRKIRTLKSAYAFQSWLNTVTMNACRYFIKKNKKAYEEDMTPEYMEKLDDRQKESQPEHILEQAEQDMLLSSLVMQLPRKYRVCLFLHHYNEMSYAQIAELVKIPIKTVDTRVYRAKRILREILESEVGDKAALQGIYSFGMFPAISSALHADAKAAVTPEIAGRIMRNVHARFPGGRLGAHAAAPAAKAVIAVTACAAVAVTAAVGTIRGARPDQTDPLFSFAPRQTGAQFTPQGYTPAGAEENMDIDDEINTLEDMIGVEEAAALRGYVRNGGAADEAAGFLAGLGMRMENETYHNLDGTEYDLYTLVKRDKILMVITERAEGAAEAGVAYRFTTAGERPPLKRRIIETYGGWQGQIT
jgi:RNA polymerase sigma-70 factor (ECF subfamily)